MGKISINILFEDNHIIIVEKPVNIPVQADESGDVDLLTLLKQDIKERYNKPGNVFMGLVHRLDRPVGGVMVFAKTSKAASRLSEHIRTMAFKKTYIAVVNGEPENKTGTLKDFLIKDKNKNISRITSQSEEGAKEAVLDYSVLSGRDSLSLVKINLHTGRSHQIRVQFAGIGHPLYGDQKYGSEISKTGQQIALWSYEIKFVHPVTKEEMVFRSVPKDGFPWNLFDFGS